MSKTWHRFWGRSAIALICIVAGCGLFAQMRSNTSDSGPVFPHKVHIEKEQFGCTDCHRTVLREASASMPTIKGCMLCHEKIDPEQPPEKRVAAFLIDGVPRWKYRSLLGGDLRFSHVEHADAKVECVRCHGDVANASRITSEVEVEKDDCLDCHAKERGPTNCEACHDRIRSDTAPRSHGPAWTRTHGERVLSGETKSPLHRCEQCHSQSSCGACHLRESPSSHSNLWRRRSHGPAAAFDRDRCVTCHRADSCVRCHETTRPMSHGPLWAAEPAYSHCTSGCHLSTALRGGCPTCHQSLDGHASATPSVVGVPPHPMPAPGFRCSACHL